jgi:hypothetical protein
MDSLETYIKYLFPVHRYIPALIPAKNSHAIVSSSVTTFTQLPEKGLGPPQATGFTIPVVRRMLALDLASLNRILPLLREIQRIAGKTHC